MNTWDLFLVHKIGIPTRLFETFKTKPAQMFKDNQIIYRQGEIAKNFYYLKEGRVQAFVNSTDGLEKILAIYKKGEIFGEASFFDGFPRMSSAKTFSDSEIININKSDIMLYFQKEPLLALNFIELLSKKVRMLSNEIDNISFLPAEKRIAQYLLNVSLSTNCSIDRTHEDIGKAVGVSRVTVSRTLNKFSQYQWINTKYKKILVLNKNALLKFLET
ncbi:Crp/Fnr family transcriptional regulator [Clostridium autoethanogenum]|nr:Crp/Fnr family transcriptional regulator [Clostridium autoethanogenum]AGY77375.1 Crp/Fnr family transcriptional regulator [Clostridium autoethanogenum DSM 10061]ALU37517.1 Transcriptional regulator Crp/Fnr family [Clostridium autoethanogenum DSM 10061]OVY49164.1 cAMP receptor protein [Clostridium autoethanogenum]